ncbi:dirigent protein 24-like [Juglans microcarpa x Juglans regia]|uniref:dirigent protein 24-like n=1 Tax=Juglans microcarpa x Juglans regia TaxID=2249226 RepID=UPI001B7D9B66|nr:dirigent protein 24-like [Juglans microcarpa x Juglans regia]
MVKLSLPTTATFKASICLSLLLITFGCANSARVLDEVDPIPPVLPDPPQLANPATTTVPNVTPHVGPTTTLPSDQVPATPIADDTEPPPPESEVPDIDVAPQPDPEEPDTTSTPIIGVAPVAGPTTTAAVVPTAPVTATSGAIVAKPAGSETPTLTFFMHDILGGTHPSARVVTGIITDTQINGLPFSEPNSDIFPLTGGVPLTNANLNGIINNNNLPFIAGLNGVGPQASTVIQNGANNGVVNGGNNLPFVTAGQLPSGLTLQKLMFGSLTVIDDELTEGHEMDSAHVVGKAQGFYLASSLDGTSQTVALTVLLHGSGGGDHHQVLVEDTISFFGVHRTALHESQISVVGGTGKYENAKGYATVETLHPEDQHTTDGVDTILQFGVYLSD